MTLGSAQLGSLVQAESSQECSVYFAYNKQQITLRSSKRLEDFLDCRHICLEHDDIIDGLFDILECPLGGYQDDLDAWLA